jgi:hypothetical protein
LERGRNRRRSIGLYLDTFADEKVVEIFHFKAREAAFEKGITLGKFVFEMLSVTAESESLTMPVLLMARSSGSCTSGTSWMFRVALLKIKEMSKREIGERMRAGNCRRC